MGTSLEYQEECVGGKEYVTWIRYFTIPYFQGNYLTKHGIP